MIELLEGRVESKRPAWLDCGAIANSKVRYRNRLVHWALLLLVQYRIGFEVRHLVNGKSGFNGSTVE